MEKLIALKHKLDAIKAMGTNAKKEALASMDDFEQRMVSLMLNPFVRFGVKKYNVAAYTASCHDLIKQELKTKTLRIGKRVYRVVHETGVSK
ncbi:putative DNA ligase [Klebsiella pneumoniae]|nr:putative DNA ligase [Klebsiella pneumoniae]